MKRSFLFPAAVVLLGIFLVLAGVYVSLGYAGRAPHTKPAPKTGSSMSRLVPPSPAVEKSDMEMAVEQYSARKAEEEAQRQAAAQAAAEQEASRNSSTQARPVASGGSGGTGGGSPAPFSGGYSEQEQANAILAGIIAQYPILQGTVVYIQQTPNGWEGAAYYKSGVILVNPNHTYPLYDIIYHEAMHVLDWREDGKIDNNDSR